MSILLYLYIYSALEIARERECVCVYKYNIYVHGICTSSTAQGGGGSFKNRKPIGGVGCCESGMAKRIH